MVCLVRSEDRKPSKRVFPLLQNLDLDTVTFEQVQGVGDPITIEDMNEQELQDLVLVNLARLAVSGEWTGLLEAGGGGGFIPATPNGVTGPRFLLAPIGTMGATDGQVAGSIGYLYACPFIAPKGNLSLTTDTSGGCSIRVVTGAASATTIIGVYDVDSGNNPRTLLATSTFDVSFGPGGEHTNAWDSAVTLNEGELYYVAWLRPSDESGTVELHCWEAYEVPALLWRNATSLKNLVYDIENSPMTSMPATFGTPDATNRELPCVGVVI